MDLDAQALGALPDAVLLTRVDVTYVGSNAAEAHWLGLLAELDRRRLWAHDGHGSLAGWLRWKYRLSKPTAKEKARVAKGLATWPAAAAAFAAGDIPYSSLRQIVRLPEHDPGLEARLITLARHGRAEDVALVVRRALHLIADDRDPEADDDDLFDRRRLWAAKTIDGLVVGGFTLGPIEGDLFLAALNTHLDGRHPGHPHDPRPDADASPEGDAAATPHAPCTHHHTPGIEGDAAATPSEARTIDQRRADALMEMACAYLAGGDPDTTGADRHTINVLTDIDTLATGELRPDSCCETVDGIPLPMTALARLACDATLIRVLTNHGRITDIGTRTRTIPPALRKKLILRDRGCQFPGCPHTRWVDAHHITPVHQHGPTDAANLVLLCGYHHHLIHRHRWRIHGNPEHGRVTFTRPDGRALLHHPPLRRAC
jgi:hypothetical protein